MKYAGLILSFLLCLAVAGCGDKTPSKMKEVQNYMPENAVIAHRGTVYWAPELTESAFRWARNTGADYVELDVQRSKDGVLIIMHDRTFKRTTDVDLKFPGRETHPVDSFTYEEITKLDAGSPFNIKRPELARSSFKGQDVLVFEDVFRICEGKRIKRNPDGTRMLSKDATGEYVFEYEADPADNGHRPGVYIELKSPDNYPGIEQEVYNELAAMGWNPLEGERIEKNIPFYIDAKINIANTMGKILVQSFSRPSMKKVQEIFKGEVPASFLISNDKTTDLSKSEVMDEVIRFTLDAEAQFIGTNLGDANDGLLPLFSEKLHDAGLMVNVYSFNTVEQMEKYVSLVDGMITNRSDLTIDFYFDKGKRKYKTTQTPVDVLNDLGYIL
jgi:glycerophosphoryl diester phosphodiesterase